MCVRQLNFAQQSLFQAWNSLNLTSATRIYGLTRIPEDVCFRLLISEKNIMKLFHLILILQQK